SVGGGNSGAPDWPPLEADAVAVADDQHPEHEFGINRRAANLAIEGRQLLVQVSQHPRHDRVDPAQQMARWNAPFKVEPGMWKTAWDIMLPVPILGFRAGDARLDMTDLNAIASAAS